MRDRSEKNERKGMIVLVGIPCLLTGGTEIQTLSLVEALVAAGHRPVVACYFEWSEGMVKRYERAGAVVVLLSRDGCRCVGVKNTLIHLWKGLRSVVGKYRPDVAHVQYMAPGALPILVLKLLGVNKILATAHTAADIYPSLRQIHWLVRHVLVAFQCITLKAEVSFFGTGVLFGPDFKLRKRGNHFTIYNNLPSYISPAAGGRTSVAVTIGVVSRLERIKGMDLVVPAFARIYDKYPQVRLLIVGDGSLRGSMERQAAEAHLPAGTIEFAGRQPQDVLAACYDRTDILLMPSRSEGFGLTAIEGMARGCVPVVAGVGGLPEVVHDGVCGLVHLPENVEDMAAKIEQAMGDFQRLSAAALVRARDFSREQYQRNIAGLYSKI